jgi:hypothetical protein
MHIRTGHVRKAIGYSAETMSINDFAFAQFAHMQCRKFLLKGYYGSLHKKLGGKIALEFVCT